MAKVKVFKSPTKAILNCSRFNEPILVGMDKLGDDCLQSVSHNFVKTLTEELSREMGLKSATEVGLSIFGMRVMNDLLILLRHKFPS